jgi:hypothetical protein
MRLTLRTLLAYLDNMLDPADAEALRSKIEESEFAKILTERMEATIRQPRLNSLPLDEKGLGLDANSIAQYLDNTLSPELVPELEQFLLQSDMQLAEVAACHQILAAILEMEPIVSPELRHRVRCLGSPQEIAQGANTGASKSDPMDSYARPTATSLPQSPAGNNATYTPAAAPRSEAMQPSSNSADSMSDSLVMADPLRPAGTTWGGSNWDTPTAASDSGSPTNRWTRVLITLALLVLLILAALQAVGPLNRIQDLWTTAAITSQPTDKQATQEPEDANKTPEKENLSLANDSGSADSPAPPNSSSSPNTNSETVNNEDSARNNTNLPETAKSMTAEIEPADSNRSSEKPLEDNAATDVAANTASKENSRPSIPLNNLQVASWQPASESPNNHLLFALDRANNQLYRVTTATSFVHGTQLLVAPTQRYSLSLKHNVIWNCYGTADMKVETATQFPWLTIANITQGKAVVQDISGADFIDRPPQLLIRNGNSVIRLLWLDVNSAVAIEANPLWVDPSAFDPNYTGSLMATTEFSFTVLQGRVEFSSFSIVDETNWPAVLDPGQAGEKLTIGDVRRRVGAEQWENGRIDKTPLWIETPQERPIDRQAAGDLMQLLPAGARSSLVLRESLNNRRPEVAALAAQTLILADDYSFLAGPTGMLNDERFRSHWSTLIDLIRERISTSQASFEALQVSLTAQDVQRGALLFQVLVGYSLPELKLSAADRLVNLLESEYLDERILAIYQLKRLTGKDLGFQPDRPARGIVQDWKRLWRTGGLLPK